MCVCSENGSEIKCCKIYRIYINIRSEWVGVSQRERERETGRERTYDSIGESLWYMLVYVLRGWYVYSYGAYTILCSHSLHGAPRIVSVHQRLTH